MVERVLDVYEVIGSSPIPPTGRYMTGESYTAHHTVIYGRVAQLVRAQLL